MQEKLSKSAINSILARLKEYLGVNTDTELANCLDIKQNTISSWKSRGKVDLMLIIAKYDDLSLDWLLKGSGDRYQDSSHATGQAADKHRSADPKRAGARYHITGSATPVSERGRRYKASDGNRTQYPELPRIPLYDLDTASGLSALFVDPEVQAPVSYLSIPNLPLCDGAVYIRGDQTHNMFKSGDIVLYKRITDTRNIIWGETYLLSFSLDGDEYVTVKIISKPDDDSDDIILTGHNPDYAPMKVPISSIRALAIVKASVRFNTMK